MLPDLETLDEDLLEDDEETDDSSAELDDTEDEWDDFSDLPDDDEDETGDEEEAPPVGEFVVARSGFDFDDIDDDEPEPVLRAVFDREQLHHYWTRGEGLAKWSTHPHPWTALYHHLLKYVGPGRAERMASEWFHEVFGIWSGERKGRNPVGPG